MKTLLVIDLQNDYFSGGRMELVGIEQAAGHARRLVETCRENKIPVIHLQHIATRPGATFFLPETEGVKIHPTLTPAPGELVLTKHYPNSFRETNLLAQLKKTRIETVIVCGAMTHMCIDATTRAAFDLGFNCLVAEDACATRDLVFKEKTVRAADVHASFMAALAVPYARVVSTSELSGSLG